MKLIIATINSNYLLEESNRIKLQKELLKLGIEKIIFIYLIHKLIESLNEMNGEEFFLISNFPPNSAYDQNKRSYIYHEDEEFYYESAIADSYSISKAHFKSIFSQYPLKRVLFITGAPESMVSHRKLNELSPEITVSLIRKIDVIKSGIPYGIAIRRHIINYIKEVDVPAI